MNRKEKKSNWDEKTNIGRPYPPDASDTTGYRPVKIEDVSSEEPEDWDEERIDDLKSIHNELARRRAEGGQDKILIDDEKIKKRIAEICYDIVQDTSLDRKRIMDRAYILSTFIEFDFNDPLDTVFEKMVSLVPPENHTPEQVFNIWREIEEILRNYLKEKGENLE